MRDIVERKTKHHPDVLLTKYNLGCILADDGDSAAARRMCTEAAEAHAKVLGETHPEVLRVRPNLAELVGSREFIAIPPPPPAGTPLGTFEL